MESEQILWFVFVAVFFALFIASVVRYHTNPKVLSQLAIFSFLCAIITIVLAARHIMHKPSQPEIDDLMSQQAWLHDTPLPLILPTVSILLFNALFDAQLQFFQFYAVVLTNYDRWSALHTYPSHDEKNIGNPNLFSSAWRWTNLVLLMVYGMTVIGLIACQAIFNASSQAVRFWLSRAIGTSILVGCVLLNLLSNVYTRYKMKHRYHHHHLKNTNERSGFKKAALTTPEDKSKRSQLILIVTPILSLIYLMALVAQMWLIYWSLIHTDGAPAVIPPSLFDTITIAGMVLDSVFICIPITLIFVVHVFFVKPYPLIVSSNDMNSLP